MTKHIAVCQSCGNIVAAIVDQYYSMTEIDAEVREWQRRGDTVKITQEDVCVNGCECEAQPNNKMKLTLKGRGETPSHMAALVAAPLQGSLF